MPYVSEFDEDKLVLKIGHGCPIFKPSPKTHPFFQMTLRGLPPLRTRLKNVQDVHFLASSFCLSAKTSQTLLFSGHPVRFFSCSDMDVGIGLSK